MDAVAGAIADCLVALGVHASLADIRPRKPVLVPASPGGIPQSAIPTPHADAMAATATPNPGATPAPGGTRSFDGPRTGVEGEGIVVPTTLAGASGQRATRKPQDRPRRSAARWAVAVALAGGGALAVILVLPQSQSAAPAAEGNTLQLPAAASAAPAAPPAAPPVTPPASALPAVPTTVTIEVRGLPGGGELLLDGAPVAGASLKLRHGDRRHVIIARAAGYYDRTIEVEADRDQTVDLVLTAMVKSDKPHGHESGGSGHHASSASHGSAAPTALKTPAATAPPKAAPQGGQKKTNYDEM